MSEKMFAEVDVFVGNNTIIDMDIYQLWLDGLTALEAGKKIYQEELSLTHSTLDIGNQTLVTPTDLLVSDILDHYRTFQMLERHLQNPPQLAGQWAFQLSPASQEMLIKKYYEFDSPVVREFLGKKLSSRNRKDLDDVSEKTGINIRSCRRQFDNVKRVYKVVEDQSKPLIPNIQNSLLLPEGLARKYAAIAYMTNNRFETSKRKLQYLTFDDFLHCALEMMSKWSCHMPDCRYEETAMDIDREFLQELRELKILLEKDLLEEHRSLVLKMLRTSNRPNERAMSDMENNFKSISRTIINIAYGLNHSREAKDLFVDIVEKIVDSCRNARWTYSELQRFLDVYSDVPIQNDFFSSEMHLTEVWERYMKTLSSCILKLYHH